MPPAPRVTRPAMPDPDGPSPAGSSRALPCVTCATAPVGSKPCLATPAMRHVALPLRSERCVAKPAVPNGTGISWPLQEKPRPPYRSRPQATGPYQALPAQPDPASPPQKAPCLPNPELPPVPQQAGPLHALPAKRRRTMPYPTMRRDTLPAVFNRRFQTHPSRNRQTFLSQADLRKPQPVGRRGRANLRCRSR